jgi:hypothetical protein
MLTLGALSLIWEAAVKAIKIPINAKNNEKMTRNIVKFWNFW